MTHYLEISRKLTIPMPWRPQANALHQRVLGQRYWCVPLLRPPSSMRCYFIGESAHQVMSSHWNANGTDLDRFTDTGKGFWNCFEVCSAAEGSTEVCAAQILA